ncbi:hypothetical protein E2C01_050096 [Portunus trituberculatus]|uniref:Uncharacterized protein n=1 Tax=Portunus trituberculatus TaxID=210409 RepID=A0A5B7GB57_PORTR|nr:hypothetical protein [Portunus trituberculatus]
MTTDGGVAICVTERGRVGLPYLVVAVLHGGGGLTQSGAETHTDTRRGGKGSAAPESRVTTLQAAAPLRLQDTAAARPTPPAAQRLLPCRPSCSGHTLPGACRSWQAAGGAMWELPRATHIHTHSTAAIHTDTPHASTNTKRRCNFYCFKNESEISDLVPRIGFPTSLLPRGAPPMAGRGGCRGAPLAGRRLMADGWPGTPLAAGGGNAGP